VTDQIRITLSHPDRFGHFRVHARTGDMEYMGFFNPADEWRRKLFAQNALSACGWPESPEHIEAVMGAVLSELRRLEKAGELGEETIATESMSSVKGDGVKWLWPGRIALGKLCVIAGDPGLGKSLLTLSIAAHASRGAPWPDGTGLAPESTVLLLSAEDDFVDTIRPRLVAAGADLDRVMAVKGVVSGTGSKKMERMLDIAQDVDKLRAVIEGYPAPRALVIDPISSFLGATGENANAEVRKLLQPMTMLAQETGTAVILVSHLRKAKGSGLHRIIGSIAFAAVARSAFVVQRVKEMGKQGRRLVPVKSNLGGPTTALRFYVEEHAELHEPHVVWGRVEAHDGLTIPDDQRGRPEGLKPDAVKRIEARLAEGPATVSELREILQDEMPAPRTFYDFINRHYQWLPEKRGRERLLGLRTPGEERDE
jgi:putative DNA primase/helicase